MVNERVNLLSPWTSNFLTGFVSRTVFPLKKVTVLSPWFVIVTSTLWSATLDMSTDKGQVVAAATAPTEARRIERIVLV